MAYHVYDHAAAQRLLRARNGGVGRDMWARGQRVQRAQQRLVGRSQGRGPHLADNIHVRPLTGRYTPGVEVGSDLPQALHLHRGHGVIVPKRAKALRFRPRGSTRFIFVKRVGPVPPNRYLSRSLRAARRGGY